MGKLFEKACQGSWAKLGRAICLGAVTSAWACTSALQTRNQSLWGLKVRLPLLGAASWETKVLSRTHLFSVRESVSNARDPLASA